MNRFVSYSGLCFFVEVVLNFFGEKREEQMADITKFEGIMPAFYACYDDDGEVSQERAEALTKHLVKKGVRGVYVGGSSGECIYQNVEERKKTLEAVVRAAEGKLTIIAHVACNSTRDSCALATHAESLGVDAIASIPPIYFKLPEYAVQQYWNDISNAAPNTPFVIYNIPQLAGTELTVSLFREMLKNPRVIAVKNSSMPVQDIEIFEHEGAKSKRNFIVFNGPDEQLVSGLVMGARGGIGGTYAVMPELIMKIYDIVKAEGDLSEARAIQYDVDHIIRHLNETKGAMYATIKKVMEIRDGLKLGGVRAPMYNLVPEDMPIVNYCVKAIDDAMEKWIR